MLSQGKKRALEEIADDAEEGQDDNEEDELADGDQQADMEDENPLPENQDEDEDMGQGLPDETNINENQ